MFIEVNDLVKTYQNGDNPCFAVNHATFSIEKSEIVVILGPSGSGKSTLMNIIGGLESATSGSVKVDNNEIVSLNPSGLSTYRRNYVGFVFQFYNLISNLSIRENIEICSHLGSSPLDIDVLLKKVDLFDQSNKFPAQLSGGQQQRVAIARALVKNPQLLLCDEPTGALDYKTSKEVLTLFHDINRTYGTTLVMITHNDAIQKMAHRIIHIKDGMVISNEINKNPILPEAIDW